MYAWKGVCIVWMGGWIDGLVENEWVDGPQVD